MTKNYLIRFFLLGLLCFGFTNCSSEDDSPIDKPLEKSTAFRADKTTAEPLEVVRIFTEDILLAESYPATFAGTELTLGKVNDTTLVFTVPQNTLAGKSQLSFVDNNKAVELDLQVSALNLVGDPDATVQALFADAYESLKTTPINPADTELNASLEGLLNQFEEGYSQLSTDEKRVLATFLQINLTASELAGESAAVHTKSVLEKSSLSCLKDTMVDFVSSNVRMARNIALMSALIIIPEPVFSKIAAVGVGIVLLKNLKVTLNTVADLGKCIFYKGIESMDVAIYNRSMETQAKEFTNLKEYQLTFYGKYAGLSKEDLNSENSLFRSYSQSLDGFKDKLQELKTVYNKAKQMFGLSSIFPAVNSETLPATPTNSEIAEIGEDGTFSLSIPSNEFISIKKNEKEGSKYIVSFLNKTIEDQDINLLVKTTVDGITSDKNFPATVKAANGNITILKGSEESLNDNNEVAAQIRIEDEKENPITNATVEFSSSNPHVSFPSGSSVTTTADGMANVQIKVGEDNTDEEIAILVKVKNSAGEIKDETTFTIFSGLERLLINNSPWKLTAYSIYGEDHFAFMERGNKGCYPNGVYDLEKVTDGTVSFSKGSVSFTLNIEVQTYNCGTGSYVVSNRSAGFSMDWKIEGGKLIIVPEDGVATFNVTKNGDKITFSGTIVDPGGTNPFSFAIERQP